MMGGNHAATGAAAWIAATSPFQVPLTALAGAAPWLPASVPLGLGLMDLSPAGVVTGAMVCAGAALVPDADHRHATIAQSLPPVSNAVCAGIGNISGGHRNGTHSLLGIAAFSALALVASLWTVHTADFGVVYPGAGILAVLLIAFAVKALRFIPDRMQRVPWVIALPLGAFVAVNAPEEQYWFVLAVALGAAVHILGDMLTIGGCNLLWPVKVRRPRALNRVPVLKDVWKPSGRVAFPILGAAGSWREWLFGIPVAAYAVVGIGIAAFAWGRSGAQMALGLLGG